jgi:hypothetical protein
MLHTPITPRHGLAQIAVATLAMGYALALINWGAPDPQPTSPVPQRYDAGCKDPQRSRRAPDAPEAPSRACQDRRQ